MAVCCFSLTGLPLTIGFLGKILIIRPALAFNQSANPYSQLMFALVIITMLNAAISAGYYLKIVAFLFLRSEPSEAAAGSTLVGSPAPLFWSRPVALAVVLSVFGTIYYGVFAPATNRLAERASAAAGQPLAPMPQDSEPALPGSVVPVAAVPVSASPLAWRVEVHQLRGSLPAGKSPRPGHGDASRG